MPGLSASGLKTQIKSYTEVSDTVLTNDVLENIILTIEPGVEVIGTTAFLGNRIDLQGVSVQSKLNEKSFNISL